MPPLRLRKALASAGATLRNLVSLVADLEESPQGLRALYVALTRPTRRLVVIHTRPLPAALRG